MQEDKIKWNIRYINNHMPTQTSELLLEFEDLLPHSGRVLDIACGNGRNLKFLAKKGLECEGIDISEVALAKIQKIDNIHTFCMDLDGFKLEKESYDVILNFYFLDRRILSQVSDALRSGGYLFLETFIEDALYPTTISPNKILRDGELEKFFCDLKIIHQSTKIILRNQEKAKIVSLVAQKC
ncbi:MULTISPECIES: class I SAM-dependent methyltransferase [unclassified Helicobacter]|uniref:class I SAM-dependent methyltransferase n=1 Tax=unclassified Helicobacter TaxID=2593540 RepID=UPI000CF09254|nr:MULTISPECIES: class I SAM-dependent methyltransferase [unclassified Helicobacter]